MPCALCGGTDHDLNGGCLRFKEGNSMRVGDRIKQVLTILEVGGPQAGWQVAAKTPDCESSNVHKYLSRSVGLGLVTRTKPDKLWLYAVKPNWREIMAKQEKPKPPPPRTIIRNMNHGGLTQHLHGVNFHG